MRKREENCAIKGYQLGGKNKILYTWLWGHPFYATREFWARQRKINVKKNLKVENETDKIDKTG